MSQLSNLHRRFGRVISLAIVASLVVSGLAIAVSRSAASSRQPSLEANASQQPASLVTPLDEQGHVAPIQTPVATDHGLYHQVHASTAAGSADNLYAMWKHYRAGFFGRERGRGESPQPFNPTLQSADTSPYRYFLFSVGAQAQVDGGGELRHFLTMAPCGHQLLGGNVTLLPTPHSM